MYQHEERKRIRAILKELLSEAGGDAEYCHSILVNMLTRPLYGGPSVGEEEKNYIIEDINNLRLLAAESVACLYLLTEKPESPEKLQDICVRAAILVRETTSLQI